MKVIPNSLLEAIEMEGGHPELEVFVKTFPTIKVDDKAFMKIKEGVVAFIKATSPEVEGCPVVPPADSVEEDDTMKAESSEDLAEPAQSESASFSSGTGFAQ